MSKKAIALGNGVGIWDIRRSILADPKRVSALPNVLYLTIGEKRTKGQRTGERSIVAYVGRKVEELEPSQMVPKVIHCTDKRGGAVGSVQTDVISLENTPKTFGIRAGQLLRGFDDDQGICALAYENSQGQKRILTNAHVVVDVRTNGQTGIPAVYNRADGNFYELGHVLGASKLRVGTRTTHDVAVLSVPDEYALDHLMVQNDENDIDSFAGMETLSQDEYWFVARGETFKCAFPERVIGDLPIEVDGVIVYYAECWQMQMTEGEAAPGLSGALVCKTVNSKVVACGLLFGGVQPNLIYVFPFNKMWNRVKSF
jgi:hypothetical protein